MPDVIPLWPLSRLPVANSPDTYPVRRIWCVGRNYAAHVREMGGDPDREVPFFFAKPADALVVGGGRAAYPPRTAELHHEVELVVAIGAGGRAIPEAAALDHVWGYAVGIDMTRRDLQSELRKAGRPWALAKGFDDSAPCGALAPAQKIGHPADAAIWLTVDGEPRQRSTLAHMTWSVAEIIAHLSAHVGLQPGDLIFTGTPDGVGPVLPGQRLEAGIDGVGTLSVTIAPPVAATG